MANLNSAPILDRFEPTFDFHWRVTPQHPPNPAWYVRPDLQSTMVLILCIYQHVEQQKGLSEEYHIPHSSQ